MVIATTYLLVSGIERGSEVYVPGEKPRWIGEYVAVKAVFRPP